MIDPETTKTVAEVVGGFLAGDTMAKILGPTAKYFGEKLHGKFKENIDAIFSRVPPKLGDKINSPGQVHPRVVKQIIDEGRFCEDEITREYFAGILASSRVEDPTDDRGAAIANSIRGLSAYQLKLHYVIYYLFREKLLGENLFINANQTGPQACLFMPSSEYFMTIAPTLDYDENTEELKSISSHVLYGLKRNFLVDEKSIKSDMDNLMSRLPNEYKKHISSNGCIFYPSHQGGELFLWAHGYGNKPPGRIFDKELIIPPSLIPLPECEVFVLPAAVTAQVNS